MFSHSILENIILLCEMQQKFSNHRDKPSKRCITGGQVQIVALVLVFGTSVRPAVNSERGYDHTKEKIHVPLYSLLF
jgi:hypothetical protein